MSRASITEESNTFCLKSSRSVRFVRARSPHGIQTIRSMAAGIRRPDGRGALRVEVLTGSLKGKARQKLLEEVGNGEVCVRVCMCLCLCLCVCTNTKTGQFCWLNEREYIGCVIRNRNVRLENELSRFSHGCTLVDYWSRCTQSVENFLFSSFMAEPEFRALEYRKSGAKFFRTVCFITRRHDSWRSAILILCQALGERAVHNRAGDGSGGQHVVNVADNPPAKVVCSSCSRELLLKRFDLTLVCVPLVRARCWAQCAYRSTRPALCPCRSRRSR